MATGMEYMLRSMGLNPEELKAMAGGVGDLVKKISDQLDRIEAAVTAFDARLKLIENNGETANGEENQPGA